MDFRSILLRVRSRYWIGYTAAIILPLIASGLRMALVNVFVGPYVAFFVVVLIVALIGTRSAGAIATIFSALLATRLLLSPVAASSPRL